MGCVPSSNTGSGAIDSRASTSSNKPHDVELTGKSSPKSASTPTPAAVNAPKETEKNMDRGTDAIVKIEPAQNVEIVSKAEADVPQASTDAAIEPAVQTIPLAIETKGVETEPILLKTVEESENDELMLDFDTFVLFPEVQQVLAEGSVKAEMLQELFYIVDKDADGFVNDQEREDLLELISLSYGAKSKPTTPVNRDHSVGTVQPAPLPPVPTLVLKAPSEEPAVSDAPAETQSASEGEVSAAVEESGGAVSPLSHSNSEASTSTKSGKRKPKIIKFISPELVVHGDSQPVAAETKSVDAAEVPTPTTPLTPTRAAAKAEEEARDLPPQKKGFMVTRRERESFGSRDSSEQGQSRFFVLDHGTLSYMDSTSRTPPFSMTHREIALKGVDVQVKNNTIELTPLAISSESGEQDEEGDVREIVILELKNEKECAVWMEAITEHMKISQDA